jgi:hypothetical protein
MKPVSCPMMIGVWETVDFNNNLATCGMVMVRIVLNNFVAVNDVEGSWVDSRTLKIRTRWPDYFTNVLPMMGFDTNTINGNVVPTYGRNHQLTVSFGLYVKSKMDKTNQVWDEGFIAFDREMDLDLNNLEVQVLEVEHGQKKGTILEITAKEASSDDIEMKAKVTAKTVKTASSTGKTYPNVRNREEQEDEMEEDDDDDETDPSTQPQSKKSKSSRLANQLSAALQRLSTSHNQEDDKVHRTKEDDGNAMISDADFDGNSDDSSL